MHQRESTIPANWPGSSYLKIRCSRKFFLKITTRATVPEPCIYVDCLKKYNRCIGVQPLVCVFLSERRPTRRSDPYKIEKQIFYKH